MKKLDQNRKEGGNTPMFLLHFWPPVMVAIKKYINNSQALDIFFKTTHKKHRVPSPYEKLRRASPWY